MSIRSIFEAPATRRTLFTAAGIGAGAFALAACGSNSDNSNPGASTGTSSGSSSTPQPSSAGFDPNKAVTITFMHAMASGSQKPALEQIVKDFNVKFPKITVQLQDQPDYNTLHTKTTAQIAAGSAPTLAQAYENWASEYVDAQMLVQLDDLIAKGDSNFDDLYDGVKRDLKLPDGKTWMWPFNKSIMVIYRNNEMVPDAPETWDDFATVAKNVSKNGVVAVSIDPGSSSGPSGGTQWFTVLAEAFGNPVFKTDGTPDFTAEGSVKALEYMVDLAKANALALGKGFPGQEALGNQKGAFDVSSVASFPFNMKAVGGKFEMGVSPLPSGPNGAPNSLAGTNVVMFNENAGKDSTPDQQAAGWEFLKFLSSTSAQAGWAAATGYLPVDKKSLDDPAMADVLKEQAWVKEVAPQLDTASALPGVTTVNQASGLLAVAMQDAIQGKSAPADALKAAQDKAAKLQ